MFPLTEGKIWFVSLSWEKTNLFRVYLHRQCQMNPYTIMFKTGFMFSFLGLIFHLSFHCELKPAFFPPVLYAPTQTGIEPGRWVEFDQLTKHYSRSSVVCSHCDCVTFLGINLKMLFVSYWSPCKVYGAANWTYFPLCSFIV